MILAYENNYNLICKFCKPLFWQKKKKKKKKNNKTPAKKKTITLTKYKLPTPPNLKIQNDTGRKTKTKKT